MRPTPEEIYLYWRAAIDPLSYSQIGMHFRITRGAVSGAVDRNRKPEDGRVERGKNYLDRTGAFRIGVARWVNRTRPIGT